MNRNDESSLPGITSMPSISSHAPGSSAAWVRVVTRLRKSQGPWKSLAQRGSGIKTQAVRLGIVNAQIISSSESGPKQTGNPVWMFVFKLGDLQSLKLTFYIVTVNLKVATHHHGWLPTGKTTCNARGQTKSTAWQLFFLDLVGLTPGPWPAWDLGVIQLP